MFKSNRLFINTLLENKTISNRNKIWTLSILTIDLQSSPFIGNIHRKKRNCLFALSYKMNKH